MDGPRRHYAQSNKSEKQILCDLTYMCNLKSKTTTITGEQAHRYRKQISVCQRHQTAGETKWVKSIQRNKLPVIK